MFSKLNAWLHLWLGLITGIVVLVVSLTGCVYVFVDEIKAVVYEDRLFVTPAEDGRKPLSEMLDNAGAALGPEYEISRCDLFPAPDRSWVFRAMDVDPDGIGHWNYFRYYYRVYVNPYTAEVIRVEDTRNEFFQLILSLHMNLLLGKKAGHYVVGYSVLIFVFLLLSGLVLWWPRKWNLRTLKQSLKVKWNARFKRLNYDLHNVWGFYILIPALVLAVTGLVYTFSWVENTLYFTFSGGGEKPERHIPVSHPAKDDSLHTLDRALIDVLDRFPGADMVSIRFRSSETAPYDFQVRKEKGRTYHFDWSYYDRGTGDFLWSYDTADLNTAQKVRAMNFDLHVGSFMGLGSKILMFVVSLICASLPVTGFLIWYNRKWKKKKPGKA